MTTTPSKPEQQELPEMFDARVFPLIQAFQALSTDVGRLIARLDYAYDDMSRLAIRLETVEAELADLRANVQLKRPPDDLPERIMNFFMNEVPPGFKINPTSVARNIDADPQKCADRMRTLARRNKIKWSKVNGHNSMYWYEPLKGMSNE